MKKIGTKLSKGEANLVKAFESLFPKKSAGGQLLATAASFIPGFGSVISPVVSMVDGMIDQNKAAKDIKKPANPVKVNTNPFGNLALGGGIQNQGFKQYNTGSHISGNDQLVNEAGIPNGVNPVASIQNKENMFMVDGKPFVMSDTLVNPKTGNTINVDAAKLNKKLDKAAFDTEQKNALNFGMKRLATINDAMKMMQQAAAQPQMFNGGNPPTKGIVDQTWDNLKQDASEVYDFGKTVYNEGSKVGNVLLNTNDLTIPSLKNIGNQLWNSGVAIKDKFSSYQKFNGGEIIPRRVDPLTGREYNLLTDAPANTEEVNPLAPEIPLANNPFNITTNNSFMPGNFQVSDPDPLAMDNVNNYPNNKQVGEVTPLDFKAIGNSVAKGATENRSPAITPPVKKDPYNNWANKVAIGLKGVALAKSFADTLRKAEVEDPLLPNYEKSDRYMQEANIDYTQARQNALGASNIGANINRSASNNFAAFQGREQARVANLMDSLGGIDMQENNQRSQLNLTRAQYEQQKAIDTTNRLAQNRIDNFQNLATDRLADEKFFTELSQVGSEFNKYNNFRQQLANNKELQQFYINEGLMILNNKYADFGLDPDFVEKLKSGNYTVDDVIRFNRAVEKAKSTTTTKTTE